MACSPKKSEKNNLLVVKAFPKGIKIFSNSMKFRKKIENLEVYLGLSEICVLKMCNLNWQRDSKILFCLGRLEDPKPSKMI